MARIRIRIIFEDHFIRIFEYLNIRAHHWVTSTISCPDSYKHWTLVIEYLDENGEVNTTELYEAGNSDIYNHDGLGLLEARWIQIPRFGEREVGKGLLAAIE